MHQMVITKHLPSTSIRSSYGSSVLDESYTSIDANKIDNHKSGSYIPKYPAQILKFLNYIVVNFLTGMTPELALLSKQIWVLCRHYHVL